MAYCNYQSVTNKERTQRDRKLINGLLSFSGVSLTVEEWTCLKHMIHRVDAVRNGEDAVFSDNGSPLRASSSIDPRKILVDSDQHKTPHVRSHEHVGSPPMAPVKRQKRKKVTHLDEVVVSPCRLFDEPNTEEVESVGTLSNDDLWRKARLSN